MPRAYGRVARASHREWIMKSTVIWIAMLTVMFSVASSAAPSKVAPAVAHSVLRFESHSDAANPDDYMNVGVMYSGQLEGRVIGNVFYMYKQNMTDGNVGGWAAGANVVRVMSGDTHLTLGYSYRQYNTSENRPVSYDSDRITLGLHHTLARSSAGQLYTAAVFNTETDWSASKTLDLGLGYRAHLSRTFDADLGYKYTAGSGDLDGHLFNQYNLDLSLKTSPHATLEVGYLFVDKLYEIAAGVEPDDDEVLIMGMKYKH